MPVHGTQPPNFVKASMYSVQPTIGSTPSHPSRDIHPNLHKAKDARFYDLLKQLGMDDLFASCEGECSNDFSD